MKGGIGCRQRKILADMIYYGNGRFPAAWRISSLTKQTLVSLENRGMVTFTDNTWTITSLGRVQTDLWRRE